MGPEDFLSQETRTTHERTYFISVTPNELSCSAEIFEKCLELSKPITKEVHRLGDLYAYLALVMVPQDEGFITLAYSSSRDVKNQFVEQIASQDVSVGRHFEDKQDIIRRFDSPSLTVCPPNFRRGWFFDSLDRYGQYHPWRDE